MKNFFTKTYIVDRAFNVNHNVKYDFSGKTVVFSGKLKTLERLAAIDLVKKAGAYVSTSISKNTTYLVVPDDFAEPTNGVEFTSKLKKAKTYKTTIITETQFRNSLGL